MKVGFTGTRHSLTTPQALKLREWIDSHSGEITEWHHGCCRGADTYSTGYAKNLLPISKIVGHPPVMTGMMSSLAVAHSVELRDPKEYLDRNKAIVDETDVLVACPNTIAEELRSGTWSTVRYARKVGRRIVIISPSGSVEESCPLRSNDLLTHGELR